MKCNEYFAECQRLAEEAVELAMQDRYLKASELDASDVYDFVAELVDGHGWVIYTHHALDVLQCTNNDNELFQYGDLSGIDCASEVYTRLAYWAMQADVLQELDAALQDAIEAEEEAEEEEGGEEDDS